LVEAYPELKITES